MAVPPLVLPDVVTGKSKIPECKISEKRIAISEVNYYNKKRHPTEFGFWRMF